MKKLNLGCGNTILKGYENYDKFPLNKSVKFIDLDKLPLDLPSNYADIILMVNTFEHLACNKLEFMKELHRILKHDGIIRIQVPSFQLSLDHITPYFESSYFDILVSLTSPNEAYYNKMFNIQSFKKQRRPIKGILYKLNKIMDSILYCTYIWEFKK